MRPSKWAVSDIAALGDSISALTLALSRISTDDTATMRPLKRPDTVTSRAESVQDWTAASLSIVTCEAAWIAPEKLPFRRRLFSAFSTPSIFTFSLISVEWRRGRLDRRAGMGQIVA